MSSRALVPLAVLWIAGATACREDELSKLEKLRDEVCACTTSACGEAAVARVPVIAGAQKRSSQVIARAMMDCLAKLYAKERPQTGPDLETGSADGAAPGSARGSAGAATGP